MTSAISFLIPAYNAAAFLETAVNSILDGNLSPGDDIIIVDDASTDQTPAAIGRMKAKHSSVRAVRHRINKGSAAAARNSGIDASTNELFFCLDADNQLAPKSVPALRDFLLAEQLDAATFGTINYFGSAGIGEIAHAWTFKKGVITLADALAGFHWPGPSGNYLYTKKSWKSAGRYDEGVGGGIDSWAFAISQICTGSRMAAMENSFYFHKFGHESASTRDVREGGQSIKALKVLLPYLDLLEDESVAYILSSEGRRTWFEQLEKRPLKVRGAALGIDGAARKFKKNFSIVRSLRFRLGRLIAGT